MQETTIGLPDHITLLKISSLNGGVGRHRFYLVALHLSRSLGVFLLSLLVNKDSTNKLADLCNRFSFGQQHHIHHITLAKPNHNVYCNCKRVWEM